MSVVVLDARNISLIPKTQEAKRSPLLSKPFLLVVTLVSYLSSVKITYVRFCVQLSHISCHLSRNILLVFLKIKLMKICFPFLHSVTQASGASPDLAYPSDKT